MKQVVRGRISMLAGVAENTGMTCRLARAAEQIGIDGLMLLPAMIYKSDERETLAHCRTVAKATRVSILVYNNPVSHGVDITPEMFRELADISNLVALKDSTENVRLITDLVNIVGDRTFYSSEDERILESVMLGAQG
jgi:4-hydroxy-tetrahydrodipicolinate synthase